MYFTPGANPNELGDFEVVQKDGQLHAFYLSLPSHDAVGHLVSDDGINWTPLPAAKVLSAFTAAPTPFTAEGMRSTPTWPWSAASSWATAHSNPVGS